MIEIPRAKRKTTVERSSFCAVILLERQGGTINQHSISISTLPTFVSIATIVTSRKHEMAVTHLRVRGSIGFVIPVITVQHVQTKLIKIHSKIVQQETKNYYVRDIISKRDIARKIDLKCLSWV